MKHIHFIGICGVGMSSLAILWKKKGWKVTGSDVGFYPPISTHLQKHDVEYYPGWHTEKMGKPDLVVVGNVAGSENPEWKFVMENKIPYVSYPELIAQNLVKENSIVCAGTYGKTSTTALLTWILKNADYKPAYMFGGLSLDMEESADNPENSQWSILEGDEYKTSRWDNRAKFFSYKPTHLLLTAVEWDHADIYPTEKKYFNAFKELIEMIPNDGLIVACTDNTNIKKIIQSSRCRVVQYGKKSADYVYTNLTQSKNSLQFNVINNGEKYHLEVPIIGEYNAENICGAFAMAKEIGIEPKKIISSIKNFHGLKRRLEKRGSVNGADIFDDIAHSPVKAKSTLETLKKIYTGKIYAIFEPNTGNRQPAATPQYDHAFAAADTVIIPRLTKIKIKPGEKIIEGLELAQIISKTHADVKYFENDTDLLNFIKQKTRPDDAVVFLGSHSFRGMIEELVK